MCFVLLNFHLTNAAYEKIRIVLFYGDYFTENERFPVESARSIAIHKGFDKSRSTVLYIHGFRENQTSESVRTVVDAYIKRRGYNILFVDWSPYANGSYIIDAVPNLIRVCFLSFWSFSHADNSFYYR